MDGRSKRTEEEPCDGRVSDRQLLARFVDHHDEDAFARLVARYCGLVLGVCRRTLRDEHSAEDAFQATFLVLARRASRVRNRSSLAGWLYAVAYRTALRAKTKRHRRREQALREDMTATDDILARVTSRYEQQLLDEELDRLPAKYRQPLVLRYLMGKSNHEVARELGLRLGVVEGRLKRGKDRLRLNLAKRGIGVGVVLAAIGASSTAVEAATTDSLLAATVQAAAAFGSGAQPTGNLARNAVRLAEQELAMTTSTVAVTTSGIAAALVIAGLTLGLAGEADQSAHAQQPEIAASAAIDSSAAPSAEEGHVPIQLAAAEKRGAKPRRQSPEPSHEEKIEEALREPTSLEFLETPLEDVMDTIEDMHEFQILIDQRALDDVGIPSDTPITFGLRGVSLQSGLNLILRELDLTWVIRHEVLLITTPEEAEMMLVAKVYDVGDLVTCQDKSGELWADYDSLIEVITKTIDPASWEDVGGAGSVTAAPFRGAEMLVIAQTSKIHQEIDQLLEQLRSVAQEKGSDEPPTREKPEGSTAYGMSGDKGEAGAGMTMYEEEAGAGMEDYEDMGEYEDLLGAGMSGPGAARQPAAQSPIGAKTPPSDDDPEGPFAGPAEDTAPSSNTPKRSRRERREGEAMEMMSSP
jgi:RNA polymerase sigma factor (sigma-70 family)